MQRARIHWIGLAVLSLCLAATAGCRGIRPPKNARTVSRLMTVTGYCKCGVCCGWTRTWYGKPVYNYGANKGKRKRVGITASGAKARVGTIAADRSLYRMGTVMYVEGYGYGRVEDTGGAIDGQHIDLFFKSHEEALKWGRKRMPVRIWLPKS